VFFLLALTAIPLLFTIGNAFSMRVVRNRDADEVKSSVTILIPMRNEERNVEGVLDSLSQLTMLSDFKVAILDDSSTDSTAELVQKYPSVSYFAGTELPEGWLGKNFACHQLVAYTTGEYLVFIDADVRLTPRSVAAAITQMNALGWDFISPYPRQIAVSFFERLIQPLLQWSWMASVPLRFAERHKFASMVIANGQFFIVKREAYIGTGGHKAIRHEVLDDLELARSLVAKGYKGGVAEGSDVAQTRMYNSQVELFAGYAKSLWRAFGSPAGAITAALWLFITGVLPLLVVLSGYPAAWIGYFLLVLSRVVSSVRTRSTPSSALLHPLAILILLYLMANSWYQKATGQLQWRGRSVA
jgi:glycosyltransferase involved in cell wall biosynthesis